MLSLVGPIGSGALGVLIGAQRERPVRRSVCRQCGPGQKGCSCSAGAGHRGATRPTPVVAGRKRTPESITKRLAAIDEQLATADPLNRLHLLQERLKLEREMASTDGDGANLEELEAAFVEVAAAYAERKGLTYEAWRSVGVAPRVLKAAASAAGSRWGPSAVFAAFGSYTEDICVQFGALPLPLRRSSPAFVSTRRAANSLRATGGPVPYAAFLLHGTRRRPVSNDHGCTGQMTGPGNLVSPCFARDRHLAVRTTSVAVDIGPPPTRRRPKARRPIARGT